MKINNLIIKIFLGLYLVIIIAGVIIFENIGFSGGGLEKNIHTASNSETHADISTSMNSETMSKTPDAAIKESASTQTASKQESTVAKESQTSSPESAASASETTSASAKPEATTSGTKEPETASQTTPQPSYTFANGHIANTSALKSYHVTGASYVNMHKDKTGSHSFATVPGGTTGSIISVGAYYTLIDYNGAQGYVYNSYLEVY